MKKEWLIFIPPISKTTSAQPSTLKGSPLTEWRKGFLCCNLGLIFKLSYTRRCISETSAPVSINALNFCFCILMRQEFGFPVKLIVYTRLLVLHLPPASLWKGTLSFPDHHMRLPGLAYCQYDLNLLSLLYNPWQNAHVSGSANKQLYCTIVLAYSSQH